ncbi:signal peptidase II Aspartic peptidase. MEROPS family A08 [Granulicella pectinivorans]|jgi:signal peptidase II|uniref:Lipoprotein signal peptidase n=1 Tax=Granulicella pectinivorans TaxID=474950 RepID=A0A1I6MLA8_9BACT|nr:signal peptidase II [Granulicella pectinivorans]SFS16434.1 signal peptidase II Aspartic peptidase. MEROPS family A08 [Granulicella pectinivorans]
MSLTTQYDRTIETRTRDARPILFGITVLIILLDRWSKLWIMHNIIGGYGRVIIPNFFRLDHVYNTGAAFSIFADSMSPDAVRRSLIGFSIFAIVIVLVMLWRTGRIFNASGVALALILGGAIGNVYDRIAYLHVVDFLEFHIKTHFWPSFNIADSAIVTGACLLLLEILRPQPKDAE